MKRYFVDKRVGCLAVRDIENTDPDYQGLHEDTKGVVKYWGGKKEKFGWSISDEDVDSAEKLCSMLNTSND